MKVGVASSIFELLTYNFGKLDIFTEVQMILVSFFEIPYRDRLTKNVQKLRVQVIPNSMYNVTSNPVLQNILF